MGSHTVQKVILFFSFQVASALDIEYTCETSVCISSLALCLRFLNLCLDSATKFVDNTVNNC
jgi:hypothetical protein